jgi:hypothetical protein
MPGTASAPHLQQVGTLSTAPRSAGSAPPPLQTPTAAAPAAQSVATQLAPARPARPEWQVTAGSPVKHRTHRWLVAASAAALSGQALAAAATWKRKGKAAAPRAPLVCRPEAAVTLAAAAALS